MILAPPTTTLAADGLTVEQIRGVAVATLALVALAAVMVLIELRRRRHSGKPGLRGPLAASPADGAEAVAIYHPPKDAPVPAPAGSPVSIPEPPEQASVPPREPDLPPEIPPSSPDEIGIVIPDSPATGSTRLESPRR